MDKISVRLEGGLGDILLGNRFVAAIKEKYPHGKIFAYLDTEGNRFQEKALRSMYGDLYASIETIPAKRFVKCMIESQFGVEEYKGALDNVPEVWFGKMVDANRFYDLHIDGLKWLDYDFDWLRYFRFFPRPRIEGTKYAELGNYIVVHLVSASSQAHRLKDWYLKFLIEKLSKIAPVYALTTPEDKDYYKDCNCTLVIEPIENVIELISRAKMMVSTDSGLRYIAYGCNVPVITFSSNSTGAHTVLPSHELRWLVFPELCFPLNYDTGYIGKIAENLYHNKGYAILPTKEDFDQIAIRRRYKPSSDNVCSQCGGKGWYAKHSHFNPPEQEQCDRCYGMYDS